MIKMLIRVNRLRSDNEVAFSKGKESQTKYTRKMWLPVKYIELFCH